MKKKLIITLLSLICLSCLSLGLTACNGNRHAESVDRLFYEYVSEADGYSLSHANLENVENGNVVIPDTYNGKPVFDIGNNAFFSCRELKSVTIPGSVTSIGDDAFSDCSGLTSVIIPDSVAFLGEGAFRGCSSLTSVTIPNSVTSIGENTFYGCSSLTSITIPQGVTSIGDNAFTNCWSLKSITLPESIKSMGWDTFYDCKVLEEIRYTGDIAGWCAIDPVYSLVTSGKSDKKLYIDGNELTDELVIPDGVTSISYNAFYGCVGLTSITVPDSVTAIGEGAFENCTGLTSITLPFVGESRDETTNVHLGYIFGTTDFTDYWEYVPSSLKSVTVTDATDIGHGAFVGCSGLESITINEGVTVIGDNAFADCYALASITIPDGVESIGRGAFENCSGLTTVTVPDSVTSIGRGAFENCTGLTSITLPFVGTSNQDDTEDARFGYVFGADYYNSFNKDRVPKSLKTVIITGGTCIGDVSFRDCTSITSITIPSSVTVIGVSAFANCTGITSITIPSSVTVINGSAFYDCSELEEIRYTGDIAGWCAIDKLQNLMEYGKPDKTLYIDGKEITGELFIPDGVTTIGSNAFRACTGITGVTIPESVTSIGDNAFYGCTGLTSVTLSDGLESIDWGAFENCTHLTSITVPNSVTIIGYNAFGGCSSLESITLPFIGTSKDGTKFTHFGYIFGDYYNYGNLGYVPSSLKTVVITGGTSIAGNAFYGCSSITSITIPNGVTSFGYGAFSDCAGLTNINIPDSVTSIDESAFYGCASLKGNEYGNAYYLGNDKNKYMLLIRAKDTSITSCTVHENAIGIFGSAFNGCGELKTVSAPYTLVRYLPENFIENLTVTGNGTLEKNHLSRLKVLRDLTVSDSVKLSSGVLSGLGGLKKLTIGSLAGNGALGMLFGTSSFSGAESVLQYVNMGSSFITSYYYIPSSLREVVLTKPVLQPGTFSNCTMLSSVTVSNEETIVCERAFYGCSGLTSFVLPSEATSIGSKAFEGCAALQTLQTNAQLQTIGTEAFKGCAALQSVEFAAPLYMIGQNAFDGCTALARVAFAHTSGWGTASPSAFGTSPSFNVQTTAVEVTDAAQNAENLKGAWVDLVLFNSAKFLAAHQY